jgi:glycosyltransferase involved in cell wall biosynthesis
MVESLGLPLLEAQSLGLPILAADRPYARNVCRESAVYFDPLSPDSLAQKAMLLLSNEDLRLIQARRGKENYDLAQRTHGPLAIIDFILGSASS